MSELMGREVAFVGQRVQQKILLALALSSVIPLLMLTYFLYAYIVPIVDPNRHGQDLMALHILLVLTGVVMAGGAFVLWDVGRAVSRAARTVTESRSIEQAVVARTDEIGTLMSSFSRMLGTIEQQAAEINQFALRLDSAYQELESTNARLKEFSFKDEVTRLYNRRFFSIRLEEEVSRFRRFNHPVSLVLLDLDGFKAINDELGHAAGDETLQDVAEILLRYSRGINVICRYGGDEFAVLLVETAKSAARLYADRIRQVLSIHAFAHGRRLTASFGVAALPEDVAPSADDLVNAADEALYAAKRAGKNRVSVYEDIDAADVPESEVRVG